MSRRIKAFLLAASVAAALPVVATPANAYPIDWGCGFTAVRDVTDEQGQQTWIELTYSYFVGTPDVTLWEVTCWLQTDANLGTGELANTRHTCSNPAAPAGACANPVTFLINASDNVYFCTHVEWTGSFTDEVPPPGDLVDHLLADIFSTGGVTTMGSANQIVETVVTAVEGLIATVMGIGLPTIPPAGTPSVHTITTDSDENVAGVQCDPVISA